MSFLKDKLKQYQLIIKNTGYLTIIEVIRLLMPFVSLPYIIKTVGADSYGMIVYAQTIVTYFITVINFGLDISAVKDVSILRESKVRLDLFVSSVLIIKSILLLISFIVLVLMILFIPYFKANYLLFFFCFLLSFSEVLFPTWFFQGIQKMQYITIIRFITLVTYVLSLFIFVKVESDYIYIPLLQSLTSILGGIVCVFLLFCREKLCLLIPSAKFLKNTFVDAIPFFTSRVSVTINSGIAKLTIGALLSMELVAAYDIAQKIASIALTPIQMLNQAVYPHIARTRDKIFAKKFFYLDILLAFIVALTIFLLSPYIITYFAKNSMLNAINILRVYSVWTFLAGITVYVGTPVLVAFGFYKPFNQSVIFSSILIIFLYSLCYFFKILDVYVFVGVTILTELFILSYRFIYCKKYNLI